LEPKEYTNRKGKLREINSKSFTSTFKTNDVQFIDFMKVTDRLFNLRNALIGCLRKESLLLRLLVTPGSKTQSMNFEIRRRKKRILVKYINSSLIEMLVI
jgi:hypothetical protein